MSEQLQVQPHIREFIYLDIQRVESALAQLGEGLVSATTRMEESSNTRTLGGSGGFPGIFKADGSLVSESALTNSESVILHDFSYVRLEDSLRKSRMLKEIREFNSAVVTPADFILFRGDVVFDDYEYLAQMIGDFVDIQTNLSTIGKAEDTSPRASRKRRGQTNQNQSGVLSRKHADALESLVRTFYRDRIIVRGDATFKSRGYRIQGPLQRQHLRDTSEDLRFKFGDRPSGNWLLLGQVASVGSDSGRDRKKLESDSQMDLAISEVFSQLSEIERFFTGTTPLISISPIAVYRSIG